MRAARGPIAWVLLCTMLLATVGRADDAKDEARAHFKSAVVLFQQRRFADSLAEFERSYALYGVYTTLYNIGLVHVALGHPVEAVDALESFLAGGNTAIPADQRSKVEAEIKLQQERIGELEISVVPEGAEVRVDGNVVGKAPLTGAKRFAAGHHRVEAMLEGHRTEMREVNLLGRGHANVAMSLSPLGSPPVPGTSPSPKPSRPPPDASPSPAAPQLETTSSSGNWQPIAGYGVGGLGLVTVGIGAALAIDGQSKHEDALTLWASGDKATARQTEEDSTSEKNKGYIVMGVGGAMLLGGAILVLATPSERSPQGAYSWSPWVSASAGGMGLSGAW